MRRLDVVLISAWLILGPALLVLAHLRGEPLLNYGPLDWRSIAIYGVASPLVGILFWRRHPRARFAIYIFLTMELVRSIVRGGAVGVAVAVAVVLYMQTPPMRRLYPRIDPRAVMARLRARRRRP